MSSCALLDSRDFDNQMSDYLNNDTPMFRANDDFMVISGDTGRYSRTRNEIMKRTPARSQDEYERRYNDSLRGELTRLEAKLSDSEFYEFDRNRDDIGSISEQIYFLRLKPNERREYLSMRNIKRKRIYSTQNGMLARARSVSSIRNRPFQTLGTNRMSVDSPPVYFPKGDVVLGMTMEKVIESWGTPERRDIAGDPKYRNERWSFRKNGAVRHVYFEAGLVQGWGE